MAKKTLLEVVQSMLNAITSDAVDSINDTEEALQIAYLARDLYQEMATTHEWPHLRKIIQLSSGGGSSYPTYFTIPDTVQEITKLLYDTRQDAGDDLRYTELVYLYPDEFVSRSMALSSSDTTVDTTLDYDGTSIMVRNDRAPAYWTSFDDDHIVCDSYDSTLESSLQISKVKAMVLVEPSFTVSDTFTLDFPAKDMPYFMAALKSLVWSDIANTPNQKAEEAVTRAARHSAIHRNRARGGIRFPTNYGRK